jgi:uncharacterized OB-fold protein
MTAAPNVAVCTSCATPHFPPRLVCRHCRASSWRSEPAPTAVVEEITVLRYRIGAIGSPPPVTIATVRTDAGPRMLVRLDGPAEPGDAVTLSDTTTGIAAQRAAQPGRPRPLPTGA